MRKPHRVIKLGRLKFALLIFLAFCIVALFFYFFQMYMSGNKFISSNTQDWGAFGSFVGGVLAPAASLLAGYLVYATLSSSMYQQKIILVRESIVRLDVILEGRFDAPFNNKCFDTEFKCYYGRPLKDIVYAISNGEIMANDSSKKAFLALLHNIAILAKSIEYYIYLLGNLPESENDNNWLGALERSYWIEKYSMICGRLIAIVGEDSFKGKVSKEQFESFNYILMGTDYPSLS
ncbi:hypothetical protein [Aeromonas veronii]|uniref:hypothetical protein n=1 Tax=Aeromonas veronii TaxID=654 RepID=UPI003BA2F271